MLAALSTLVSVTSFAADLPTTLLTIDQGAATVGIDRARGGSICWLSWPEHPGNAVNLADPGRLVQQSYYAGRSLDRRAEGQSPAWSPWTWNPIQGGGVASWARVTEFRRDDDGVLHAHTIPKLWDMPDEEAAAVMRQQTRIEPGLPGVVQVRCEFQSRRAADDPWGPAVERAQEIPACYFTREFALIRSYLGEGRWRLESQPPGPPWGRAEPPRQAMACFNGAGQGIALFSPAARQPWNFGPHGGGATSDPQAGPCVHVAAIDQVPLGPSSSYAYRYWLAVGSQSEVAAALDALWVRYGDERAQFLPVAPAVGELP